MNRAFKAVKDMGLAPYPNLKGLVVFITADLALRHRKFSCFIGMNKSALSCCPNGG